MWNNQPGLITCRDEALQRHGSQIVYKQRTHSKQTISLIELKVYHSKTRRTKSYSRYIINLKRIVVEFDETNNIFEDELESPQEQLMSADPGGGVSQPTPSGPASSCLLLSSRSPSRRVLRRWTLNPNVGALIYNENGCLSLQGGHIFILWRVSYTWNLIGRF